LVSFGRFGDHYPGVTTNNTKLRLLVFDSHPVQYRVPVWKILESKHPGCLHVVYGSDCSIRGTTDKEFGKKVVWDEPMLSDYNNTILNCEKGEPLSSWGSLTGKGVKEMIDKIKPDAVLLTGLNYRYDLTAYVEARRRQIPVWLRCETQDYATYRSGTKALVRSMIYRVAYMALSRIFYIGELNKKHYLKHGVPASKLRPARYGTVDRFENMSEAEKIQKRNQFRLAAGVSDSSFVIGFSGKFIEKKNPKILYQMLEFLPEKLRSRIHLYFMGSGLLEKELNDLATEASKKFGTKSYFSGFVNQTQLAGHYLAMDIMVLPSRRMGETWGLVTNEAMQSGCGVIVSDAVGSSEDFKTLERFRVFKEPGASELANCVVELAQFPRDYNWAHEKLEKYSLRATAESLANELKDLEVNSSSR
jgi:glycosyltransferase involved in cell wall biosynthesis